MINDHLSTSDQAKKLLKKVERLILYPYDDQTGKQISEWCKGATIGYGYLISEKDWPRFKDGIDEDKAENMLDYKLSTFEDCVRRSVIVPLSQQQFDALVIFAFNIGGAGLRSSSAIRMINDPRAVTHYPTLERAWKAWNKSQGVENDGLNNRRACEWDIWSKGVYQAW